MNKLLLAHVAGGLGFALSASAQHSAWLPEARKLVVTPSYVYQTFDEYWQGNRKTALGGDARQHTALLGFDYGLTDNTALDLSLGWAWSESDANFGPTPRSSLTDNGLTDTSFGIRHRFIDQA